MKDNYATISNWRDSFWVVVSLCVDLQHESCQTHFFIIF